MKMSQLKKLINEENRHIQHDQSRLFSAAQSLKATFYENQWIWLGLPILTFVIGFQFRRFLGIRTWAFKIAKGKFLQLIGNALI